MSQVQKELAGIANACAAFQPVRLIVRSAEMSIAQNLTDPAVSSNVAFISMDIDDIWGRDTLPIIVRNNSVEEGEKRVAVGLNFNGWGGKQQSALDATLAQRLASYLNISFLHAGIVGEGGGIETDGEGTAIITESSWINTNRNPGISKVAIARELTRVFGIAKVIWLPGIKNKDKTDGQVGLYIRFAKPAVIMVNIDQDETSYNYQVIQRHLAILREQSDAKGRSFTLVNLYTPTTPREPQFPSSNNVSLSYIHFLLVNNGIILPEYGDENADAAAKNTLQSVFPERTIVQINIDTIARRGGGLHSTAMQQPTFG